MKILLIEPNVTARNALIEALIAHDVVVAASAKEAIMIADANDIGCVVTELALAGHSGMEFLYEFRSYIDWQDVPVIVYTTLQLDDEVVRSSVWEKLDATYLYKPAESLSSLKEKIQDLTFVFDGQRRREVGPE